MAQNYSGHAAKFLLMAHEVIVIQFLSLVLQPMYAVGELVLQSSVWFRGCTAFFTLAMQNVSRLVL